MRKVIIGAAALLGAVAIASPASAAPTSPANCHGEYASTFGSEGFPLGQIQKLTQRFVTVKDLQGQIQLVCS